MKNTWLVAVREFNHRVRSRGFILASIAVPLGLILVWAATGLFNLDMDPPEEEERVPASPAETVIGYVDQAGLIRSLPADLPADLFRAYPDIAAANQALESGEIEVYYLVPPGYLETGEIRRVSADLPFRPADTSLFNLVLINNLLPDASPEERALWRNPFGAPRPQFVDVTAEAPPPPGEETPTGPETVTVGVSMVPMLVTIVIIIPLFTSGGYLLQSVTQEKSNRVMEILLVSLRPGQLLAGKLLGFGALTLVQYAIWIAISGIGLTLAGQNVTEMLTGINLSPLEVVYVVLFALGGYALYSAFMAGIGALAPNMEGSRSWIMIISLPMAVPMYVWVAIVNAPHSVLSVTLSLIPFSAPVAMLMRMTTTAVPPWQIALSLGLLALAAAGVIWLMARLFRVQTLLSGEAISLRRMWSVLNTA